MLQAMSETDIFRQTKDAYLCLIHPVRTGDAYRREIAPLVAVAPSVPDELVSAMIASSGWRERLVGICLAATKPSPTFAVALSQSLQDPRGVAIVPACASLAVLGRRGIFHMTNSFCGMVDRAAFDGEVGWAADKAMHFVGLRANAVSGLGPNYGQIFEDHVEVYNWLYAA